MTSIFETEEVKINISAPLNTKLNEIAQLEGYNKQILIKRAIALYVDNWEKENKKGFSKQL